MNKIISFSLWGSNPKYTIGAVKNAQLSMSVYPGWKCRFYIGRSVPDDIKVKLGNYSHVELVEMPELGNWKSMYWRFFPASEPDVDIYLSRDCDSRLNLREAEAVKEFEDSDRTFHSMRDHPAHGIPILGGMWGAKKGVIPDIKSLIDKHITDENRWGIDQDFLTNHIYPVVKDTWFEHDAYFWTDHRTQYKNGFPTPRNLETMEFVGQPYSSDDTPEIVLTDPGVDR